MSSLPILDHTFFGSLAGNEDAVYAKRKEKILQFGTGVLLRALPDYYLQKANDAGIFEGSVVVVKTTDQGDLSSFERQNYLFTHVIQGIGNGQKYQSSFINSTISRILKASEDWASVLACAEDPDIRVIISNVTEQGLVYQEETLDENPPVSFPAKLLAWLMHRYKTLGYSEYSPVIVLPTELIDNNGDVLKRYVEQGAAYNGCGADFMDWLRDSVAFCNTLVDRIVPGKPEKKELEPLWNKQGYIDHHLVVSEPYNLWAIEKKEGFEDVMSWCLHDPNVKWVEDIKVYKELKLRLLNAAHILTCGMAWYSGFTFVSDAMENDGFRKHLDGLMTEIKQSLPIPVPQKEMDDFVRHVKERFSNPYLAHAWASIMVNYSEKMKIRALPLLIQYQKTFGVWPERMLKGWAMYFMLSTPKGQEVGRYFSESDNGILYLQDPSSQEIFHLAMEKGREMAVFERLKYYFFQELLAENLLESLHSAIILQMQTFQNHKIQYV